MIVYPMIDDDSGEVLVIYKDSPITLAKVRQRVLNAFVFKLLTSIGGNGASVYFEALGVRPEYLLRSQCRPAKESDQVKVDIAVKKFQERNPQWKVQVSKKPLSLDKESK